ncbi:MAG: NCS2 family permease [candidate division Zixibacteria bacterium]|jgi:AGZA family xanthine/uracil permease-like MFS transporter|nr:NCS2 family permease [candidate division Zixibacteria bacterium]
MGVILARYFNFESLGTNFRTETTAGVTTYMTMVYIVFLQPAVLSQAGMDFGSVMMATCLSAALASFVMGVYANYPIGLAPGMGENFFFAITVVLGMGVSWQAALACVFASGVIFILLAFVKLREIIIDAIPGSLKAAIAAGIGLFIAFIGLVHAGIVKGPPTEVVALGDLHSPPVLIAGVALLLTAALMHYRIKGAILIGMIAALAAALIFRIVPYEGILSMPPSIEPTLFKLDLAALFTSEMIVVIIVFLFMDLFDTTGTLLAVSQQAGLLRNGKLPRASRALLADAVGTTFGALVGTSTVTSFIESASGVQEGGRSGFTAVVVGLLFLMTIFFYPLARMIGCGVEAGEGVMLYPITAPALIIVGSMMVRNIRHIKWENVLEGIPAFLIMVGIPLTFSIQDGFALGFISYPVLMLLAGKGKEVSTLMYILGLVFLAKHIFL